MDKNNDTQQASLSKHTQKLDTNEKSAFINNVINFLENNKIKISLSKLAEKVDISLDTIKKYSSGENPPNYETVLKCIRLCKSIDPNYSSDGLFGFRNCIDKKVTAVSNIVGLSNDSIRNLERYVRIINNPKTSQTDNIKISNYIKLLNWLIENEILLDMADLLLNEKEFRNDDEKLLHKYRVEDEIRKLVENIVDKKPIIKKPQRMESLIEDNVIYVVEKYDIYSPEGKKIIEEPKKED